MGAIQPHLQEVREIPATIFLSVCMPHMHTLCEVKANAA